MKIKKSIKKVQYTYSSTKEEYVADLSANFQESYFQFSLEQIRTPIAIVANIITSKLNYDKSYNGIMLQTDIMKNLETKYAITDDNLSQSMLVILAFLKGVDDIVRYYVVDLSMTSFPEENTAEYLKFITEAAKRVRDDICAATEAKIPHSAKIEYQRWVNEIRGNSEAAGEDTTSTFVEKAGKENTVPQEKRSFVSMVQEERGIEAQDHAKKKGKVTFESESVKKKITLQEEPNEEAAQCNESSSLSNKNTANVGTSLDTKVGSTQRSIGIDGEASNDKTQNIKLTEETNYALLNPQLIQLYAWIAELPEYLQKQILNSSPIQTLIESAKQVGVIYNVKTIIQSFAEIISSPQEPNDEFERVQEVAQMAKQPDNLVDTSMILDGIFMPFGAVQQDSAPVFGEILPEQMINWI